MGDTTWRKSISYSMKENGDDWKYVIKSTLSEKELDESFDSGYGGTEGAPFTVWTADYVYFPICYDGSEWCGSAPRNPCEKKLEHQGGG